MRLHPPILVLALATAGLACLQPATPRLLDERSADYLEDEQTGRRLARVSVRAFAAGTTRATVHIEVSAMGTMVEPVPGYRGVHGANHITARELTSLVESGRLKILAMPRRGTAKRYGRIVPGTRGTVPERRLLPGGGLDLHGTSSESYLLSMHGESPDLGPGEHEVYLEAQGVPRLRVDVRVDVSGDDFPGDDLPGDGMPKGEAGPVTATILGIASLGGHDLGMPGWEAPR